MPQQIPQTKQEEERMGAAFYMWFFKFLIPFQRSYWLTSCALGILQSRTLHPWAPFVSLITKCNLPYKYTKNYLRGCYDGVGTV
jgi:hypothetical protein